MHQTGKYQKITKEFAVNLIFPWNWGIKSKFFHAFLILFYLFCQINFNVTKYIGNLTILSWAIKIEILLQKRLYVALIFLWQSFVKLIFRVLSFTSLSQGTMEQSYRSLYVKTIQIAKFLLSSDFSILLYFHANTWPLSKIIIKKP